MIISGYQGIGKTTLARDDKNFVDLESSAFFVNGVRPDNWYVMYCQVAINLSQQGYDVLISSHKIVRDLLAQNCDEKLVLVFPAKEMKVQWISRLQVRYDQTKSDKDYKALMNAKSCFDENIEDLEHQVGFQKIVIKDFSYRLGFVLSLVRQGIYTENQTFIVGE